MMTIAIHQPNYLPNLAFFHKMASADLFVIVTNLQFEKLEGWQRRNKIKGAHADIWLTIPIKGSRRQMINEVEIGTGTEWRALHKRSLLHSYCKTNHGGLLAQFAAMYDLPWTRLVDVNVAFIMLIKTMLGIQTPVVIEEEITGPKESLIINTCKKYGADIYLSGHGAKNYMTPERIAQIAAHNIGHRFVRKTYASDYPYSTVHYCLTQGPQAVRTLIACPPMPSTQNTQKSAITKYMHVGESTGVILATVFAELNEVLL